MREDEGRGNRQGGTKERARRAGVAPRILLGADVVESALDPTGKRGGGGTRVFECVAPPPPSQHTSTGVVEMDTRKSLNGF